VNCNKCRAIRPGTEPRDDYVELCNLHEAADELLAVCEMVDVAIKATDCDPCDEIKWDTLMTHLDLKKLQDAIHKAKEKA